MEVARYNYAAQFDDDLEGVIALIRAALITGRSGAVEVVAEFEQEFAAYVGASFGRGVNTGTDALVVALRALEIGPGDEVITQANTFNASVAAIRLVGATPVLVDADECGFLIDDRQVESAISAKTRAILPVHLYGRATRMEEILRLADRHSLDVVEDAAQAHGAAVGGRRVGSIGRLGCFSFHPSKNLAAPDDGGMVVTSDQQLAAKIDRLRSLGQQGQNNHLVVGLNTHLHALQAIVLRAKLSKLDEWNTRRRQIARAYREGLDGSPGLSFQDPGEDDNQHVYHLFQVRSRVRDGLLRHLVEAGIDAVVRYPVPIHLQPAFADQGWRKGQFPVAERLADQLLCLPIRPDMQQTEVDYVVNSTKQFVSQTGSRPS